MDAETYRQQIKSKAESMGKEVNRLESEVQLEHSMHMEELDDIKATYHKLEKKVINHLHALQRACNDGNNQKQMNIKYIA